MDGWNTTFLLGFGLFSEAMLVSGRVKFQNIHQICGSVTTGVSLVGGTNTLAGFKDQHHGGYS